jgi:hypothetical protein
MGELRNLMRLIEGYPHGKRHGNELGAKFAELRRKTVQNVVRRMGIHCHSSASRKGGSPFWRVERDCVSWGCC